MTQQTRTAPLPARSSAANADARISAAAKIGEGAAPIKFSHPRLSARRWGAIRLAELKRLATWRRSQRHVMPAEPWAFALTASLAVADAGRIPTRSRRQPFVAWSGLTEETAEAAMVACGFRESEFDFVDIARAVEAARRWQSVHPGHRLPPAKCAEILGVSAVERDNLDLRTIDAVDEPRSARRARKADEKRKRDRETARAKRGRVPREIWLAARLSASKPWEAEGVSRRTWERRRARVAGVSSHLIEMSCSGDTPATGHSPNGDARGSAPHAPGQGDKLPLDPDDLRSRAPRQAGDGGARSNSLHSLESPIPQPVCPALPKKDAEMSSSVPAREKPRLIVSNLPHRSLLISALAGRPRPVLACRMALDLAKAA